MARHIRKTNWRIEENAYLCGFSLGDGGGGTTKTTSTTNTTAEPWKEVKPYLISAINDAGDLYRQGPTPLYQGQQIAQFPTGMQDAMQSAFNQVNSSLPGWSNLANNTLSGLLQPGATGYSQVTGLPFAPQMSGYGVNEQPAVWNALYGGVDNPYLGGMANSLVNQAQQSYGDMMSDTATQLTDTLLPQIRSGFNTAGQLGQTRQGMFQAEAVDDALSSLAKYGRDLNTSLGGQLANLYGSAYENAAGRSASMASQLANQSASTNSQNASLLMQALMAGQQAQQANQSAGLSAAGLDAQNNQLALSALGQLPTLANMPVNAISQQIQAYAPILAQQQAQLTQEQQNYYDQVNADWNNLARYTGQFLYPAAGMGETSSSTTKGTTPAPSSGFTF